MDSEETPASGFTRYITIGEFRGYCDKNQEEHDHMSDALWGSERTNGMVKDIHDLKMWVKFLGILGGIITPLITAALIRFIFGG